MFGNARLSCARYRLQLSFHSNEPGLETCQQKRKMPEKRGEVAMVCGFIFRYEWVLGVSVATREAQGRLTDLPFSFLLRWSQSHTAWGRLAFWCQTSLMVPAMVGWALDTFSVWKRLSCHSRKAEESLPGYASIAELPSRELPIWPQEWYPWHCYCPQMDPQEREMRCPDAKDVQFSLQWQAIFIGSDRFSTWNGLMAGSSHISTAT